MQAAPPEHCAAADVKLPNASPCSTLVGHLEAAWKRQTCRMWSDSGELVLCSGASCTLMSGVVGCEFHWRPVGNLLALSYALAQ